MTTTIEKSKTEAKHDSTDLHPDALARIRNQISRRVDDIVEAQFGLASATDFEPGHAILGDLQVRLAKDWSDKLIKAKAALESYKAALWDTRHNSFSGFLANGMDFVDDAVSKSFERAVEQYAKYNR